MLGGRIINRRKPGLSPEQKEWAARGSYSVILIVVTLFVIRPLMVSQILSRAEAYSALGMFDESERQCNKALLFDSDNSQAWCQLGHIYKAECDLETALVVYKKAAETDPTNKSAYYALATLYLQDGCYRDAIGLLEQVRTLGPDKSERLAHDGFSYHKSALSLLLTCYEKVGDSSKARFTREEIRVFYPDSISNEPANPQADEPSED